MTNIYEIDPESHAARHGVTCRSCGNTWPCDNPGTDHAPSLIPNGAIVTTYDDLDRLVYWAPAANVPVVLDRDHTPWLLYSNEDGDGYAGTIPCPDDDIPARCSLEDLPDRGPLTVVFNGDPNHTNQATKEQHA
jgi:hypothetical protein